tara:strand:- start:101 stop:529 length:429 start_codon:yes stop_codon:yes gene_type:complete
MFGFFAVGETVIGSASVDLFFTPTGVTGTGSPGSLTVNSNANVTISTGVAGEITLLANGNSSFFTTLMGVSATSEIGFPLVWGLTQVDQTANHLETTPSQAPSWSTLEPNQSTSYTTIAPNQSPSYSNVTPSHSPSWAEQEA